MTIQSENNRKDYTGNGSTTVFAYDFRVLASGDMKVYLNGVLQGSGYTVSGVDNPSGGNVTFTTAPGVGVKVTLLREAAYTQGTAYTTASKFPAATHERALDRLTILALQLKEKLARAAKFKTESVLTEPMLPDGVVGKFLRWKSTTEIENADVTATGALGLPVSEANGGTGASTFNAARTNLGAGNQFDEDPATTTGLQWGYRAGLNPRTGASIGAGTLALTASATNYIELDPVAGTLSKNTTGFTLGRVPIRKLVTNGSGITTNTDNRPQFGGHETIVPPSVQCRLTKSGANLLLSPVNGNKLTINSAIETIPDAGVTLAATSLSVGTTYFIYAFMSAGTMTLEASTTGHATQAGTGVEIKSGDGTRTLVGMARVITGPAWADTATQRFVLSWFNRRVKHGLNAFAADRTTTSTTDVELSSSERVEFLTWADEAVPAFVSGTMKQSAANPAQIYTKLGLDDATPEEGYARLDPATEPNSIVPIGISTGLSMAEGYHYITVVGRVASSGTGTWHGGGTAGERTTLGAFVRG